MFPRPLLPMLLALVSLGASASARADLKIVATVPDLAAIARELVGPHGTVESLSLPSQDPHFVDAKPSLMVTLHQADLLLVVGLGLEDGWLPPLLTNARNPKVQPGGRGYLDCSTLAPLLEVPAGRIDRSMGDVHAGGNPHYLHAPQGGAATARGVAARLAQLDPAHASDFEAALQRFETSLDQARQRSEARLAVHRGTPLVAYHRSWIYLTSWLGLEQVEFIEPKPGLPPSSAHLARVVATARKHKARLVIVEAFYPGTTSRFVAEKIPAGLVRLPAGTSFRAGQSYREHLEELVELLAKALEEPGASK